MTIPPHLHIRPSIDQYVPTPQSGDQSVPLEIINLLTADTDSDDSDEGRLAPVIISPSTTHVPQVETSQERENVEVIVLGSSDEEEDEDVSVT